MRKKKPKKKPLTEEEAAAKKSKQRKKTRPKREPKELFDPPPDVKKELERIAAKAIVPKDKRMTAPEHARRLRLLQEERKTEQKKVIDRYLKRLGRNINKKMNKLQLSRDNLDKLLCEILVAEDPKYFPCNEEVELYPAWEVRLKAIRLIEELQGRLVKIIKIDDPAKRKIADGIEAGVDLLRSFRVAPKELIEPEGEEGEDEDA